MVARDVNIIRNGGYHQWVGVCREISGLDKFKIRLDEMGRLI